MLSAKLSTTTEETNSLFSSSEQAHYSLNSHSFQYNRPSEVGGTVFLSGINRHEQWTGG